MDFAFDPAFADFDEILQRCRRWPGPTWRQRARSRARQLVSPLSGLHPVARLR